MSTLLAVLLASTSLALDRRWAGRPLSDARVRSPRQDGRVALRHRVRGGAWPLAAWLAASALIGVSTFSRVDSPTLFPQTYDTIFHLSGALWILDTGDASSLDFRAIIEPGSASFYPSAWHSLVALVSSLTSWTGVASPNSWAVLVPAAMNASWLAVCGVLWLPGIAWMTRVALPARWCGGEAGIRWLGPLAVLLGAGFVAMPFATLSFGSLYPMFLAYAATPALVGLVVVLARRWWPAAAPGGDAGADVAVGADVAAGPGRTLPRGWPRVCWWQSLFSRGSR